MLRFPFLHGLRPVAPLDAVHLPYSSLFYAILEDRAQQAVSYFASFLLCWTSEEEGPASDGSPIWSVVVKVWGGTARQVPAPWD